jgi:hypothetical protein
MPESRVMPGPLLAALLAASLASWVHGQEAVSTPRSAAVDRTSLWSHIDSATDLDDVRGGSVTWDSSGHGTLVFSVVEGGPYAWVTIPAAANGWDLACRQTVEASVTNLGPIPAEVQVWVVASHGWESVGDVATLAPEETRRFACQLRETFPDGTPKLDPGRVAGVRVLVRKATVGTVFRVTQLSSAGHAPPWTRPPGRVEVPAVENGPPAAGRRVRHQLAGDKETDIAYLLHLPDEWKPGGRYPVILEYPGNEFYVKGCYSTGLPDQCGIGYGMARGRGAIWVSLPFIDRTKGTIAESGWGDADETANFCEQVVDDVCTHFGGDRRNLILTGFSRGAIACGFIGLRNDRIAPLWKGFHLCQHYDGDGWNGATLEGALERARRFQGQAVFHTDNRENALRPLTDVMNAFTTFVQSGLGAHATAMFLDDRDSTRKLRRWFEQLVAAAPAVRP